MKIGSSINLPSSRCEYVNGWSQANGIYGTLFTREFSRVQRRIV